ATVDGEPVMKKRVVALACAVGSTLGVICPPAQIKPSVEPTAHASATTLFFMTGSPSTVADIWIAY
ncbi:MAG TPA: hypothetical protein VK629_16495, partial [Steroidobacteraceae bacterium]|nr:hypothetical protein [Steroidobacteraceae bacterium]